MKKKKKVKKAKPKTYTLYLRYKEIRSGGEVKNPEEQWSDREPTYIEFTPIDLYYFHLSGNHFPDKINFSGSADNCYWRDEEVKFNPTKFKSVFAVIVRYRDGDTFGTSHGNWTMPVITPYKPTAKKVVEDIKNEKGQYSQKHYSPWQGYFNDLEDVVIEELKIIHHI